MAAPPGKGTKEICFENMLKILSEGEAGVSQRSIFLWYYSIFINDHENGLDLSLSASNTNTKRVTSTLDDVIKIQKKCDKLEKQPGLKI